jgi:UDP-N-acetylmuramoyl-tripeptide--D-alanyl-D-alanine ligase
LTLIAALNLSSSKAISALLKWTPSAGRGQVSAIKFKKDNCRTTIHLIDESYNANPGSMRSALETLGCIFTKKNKNYAHNRRIAVLGDMLELGPSEVIEHINISRFAKLSQIDKIFCVGLRMRRLYVVLPPYKQGFWTETAEEMQHLLVKKIKNGDIIMIKGSFSMRMNTIVSELKRLNNLEF